MLHLKSDWNLYPCEEEFIKFSFSGCHWSGLIQDRDLWRLEQSRTGGGTNWWGNKQRDKYGWKKLFTTNIIQIIYRRWLTDLLEINSQSMQEDGPYSFVSIGVNWELSQILIYSSLNSTYLKSFLITFLCKCYIIVCS